LSLTYPHRKKSQGVRSGDLGGQSRWCSNLFERSCISVQWYLYIHSGHIMATCFDRRTVIIRPI